MTENSRRGRGASSSVIPAKQGSPMEGHGSAVTWAWDAQGFRHSEAAGRGIPHAGAGQYVVVIMVEPFGGFFGRLRSL